MGQSTLWQKLWAVFYKNYLYRKGRWILLILELVLTSILMAIFLAARKQLGDNVAPTFVPVVLSLTLFLDILSNVGGSVSEKETGFKELLKIMGLDSWIQWIGWLVNSLAVTIVSNFITSLIIAFAIFNKECDAALTLLIVFIFGIQAVTFAYLLSAFFSRHTVAMAIIGILWFGLLAVPEIVHSVDEFWSLASKILLCLIPHLAIGRFCRILGDLPRTYDDSHNYDDPNKYTIDHPITWANMFDGTNKLDYRFYPAQEVHDPMSVGLVFVIMLVSSGLYVILAMYIENIMPTKYGVRKPFYYPFQLKTWVTSKTILTSSRPEAAGEKGQDSNFEAEPTGLEAGVVIQNLKKSFGKNKMAVNGVTLNMYQGQITALLGHNGAGKTTTLSILTGMTGASSGTAIINGHDINKDMDSVRQELSLCPQENMLFDRLNVTHHLQFVGRLKGLSDQEALAASENLLAQFGLTDKRDVQVKELSGGMKRKLQLAMCLAGQTKIIVCDEPTSGMDPETRRTIWNVLLRMREGRTIILTTHYMEEADVLGDRIAIMSGGQVKCCGSSLFLKRIYGSGYTLHIALKNDSSTQEVRSTGSSQNILEMIQKHVPTATLKSSFSENVSEIEVTLPTLEKENITTKFPALFNDLDGQSDDLQIKHVGLTYTTLDDVFAKVGELEEMKESEFKKENGEPQLIDQLDNGDAEQKTMKKLTGFALTKRQFSALLLKRCRYGIKKYQMFLIQIILALGFMIGAILMFNSIENSGGGVDALDYLFPALVFVGLAFHASSFIILPLDEKLSKAKQLQLMTGVSPFSYWLSMFIWDFGNVIVTSGILTAFIPILQSDDVLINSGAPAVYFLILIVYGFTTISVNYTFSLIAPRLTSGFAGVLCFHLFGMLPGFMMAVWEGSEFRPPGFVSHIFNFIPPYATLRNLMKVTHVIISNTQCPRYNSQSWWWPPGQICNPQEPVYDYEKPRYACCGNCTNLASFGVKCFHPSSLVTWWDKYEQEDEYDIRPLAFQRGILQMFLYQIVVGIFLYTLLFLYEYGILRRWLGRISGSKDDPKISPLVNDSEIHDETKRVNNLVNSGRMYEDAIVANGLSKYFGNFAAVSNINFGVRPGVCFGLLGVNGAGKTTFFRMLTGDTIPSAGDAHEGETQSSLRKNKQKFLSSIGYCQQFDPHIGFLTGQEMLELCCGLRGLALSPEGVRSEARRWLTQLGLQESGHVQCRKYSGGMKRRLSTAMALIGRSPILMLDEPSSGVDPLGRRQLWKILSSSTKNSGQAIILTSHSMEECEALCSRLSIMVNGQMQCIGSVEHLKDKFAQGYCLTVKLRDAYEDGSGQVNENQRILHNMIATKFTPSILLDQNQNMMQFQLQNTKLRWSDVFSVMEDLRKMESGRGLLIDDYVVTETSLEQIFLHFARAQYPERDHAGGCFKRFLMCHCCSCCRS